MRYLLDTNVLLRLVLVDEPNHNIVMKAVTKLQQNGDELCCTTQSLRELWHVATRNREANGIGLGTQDTVALVAAIRQRCLILAEDSETFEEWLALVSIGSLRGVICHDANHAAIALSHGVERVITFDTTHFERFGIAGLVAIHPKDV